MDAASYDRWYETPRGSWIGQREAALVLRSLAPRRGESLLDVGCGTGYFTRALAASLDGRVTGVDLNPEWIGFARGREAGRVTYDVGDARALPYADASFDLVVSIAALCFIEDEERAVREILRVARRRFAVGLLNRRSLLWIRKGRGGGSGAYRGARWHTAREARRLFRALPVQGLRVVTAIQMPGGGPFARVVERVTPSSPFGGFMLVVGDVGKARDG
jgi:SAM-dependent methyltransferase